MKKKKSKVTSKAAADKQFIAKIASLTFGTGVKPSVPSCPKCNAPMKLVAAKKFDLSNGGKLGVAIVAHNKRSQPPDGQTNGQTSFAE